MNRKQFFKTAGFSSLAFMAPSLIRATSNTIDPDPLDKKLVEEFLRVAHSDMDKVKALLEEHPTLLNAAYDWNGGDFETGLGAASHVGFKELAQYFLNKGAQANIFTACLFGKMKIVKSMIGAFPSVLHAKGPHGYTLLHHAIEGGEEALKVKKYLVSLGAKETLIKLY